MRQFIVIFQNPLPDKINLKDLPGSGRLDMVGRIVNSAFWLSHDIRRNVKLHLIWPNIYIRFEGNRMRKVSPDERNIAIFIKKAKENLRNYEYEFHPGIFVGKKTLKEVLDSLNDKIYLLTEDGKEIKFSEGAFILGDHKGFKNEDLKIIEKYNPTKISLGRKSYLTSHCIVIVNYLLDLWTRGDLNPGPPPCEGGALPTELRAQK